MSVGYNPKIVNNGLVLCLDSANPKSYLNYNLATYSQDFTNAVYTKSIGLVSATGLLAPDGTLTASTLTDDVNGVFEYFGRPLAVLNDSSSYNVSIYIRKTSGGTSTRTGFNLSFSGGTAKYYNIRFNADTGVATGGDSNLVTSENNNYWRLSFTVSNNGTGNTVLTVEYFPATGFYNGNDDSAATGSHTVWGLQVTKGSELLPYRTNVNDSVYVWNDLSGKGNNGTLTNGPIYSGENKGVITFDGSNDFIDCGNNSSLNVGNTITFISWFYVNSIASYQVIGSKLLADYSLGWEFANQTGGVLRATLRPSATLIDLIADVYLINNSWNMGVMTFDNSTLRLYQNGVQVGQTFTGGPVTLNSSAVLRIGSRPVGDYFNGKMAHISMYNRVLSADEIKQNFNALRGRFGL